MTRVLLAVPRLTQRLSTPYVGQQYVAASLLAADHEVRVVEPSAPRWDGGDDAVVAEVERWSPDLIGLTLFTENALRAYSLAARLRPLTRLLIAAGPHATACPEEPLRHGFHLSVRGEGERVAVALADALRDGREPETDLPGVWSAAGATPPPETISDLESLSFPHEALPCYRATWYHDSAPLLPTGVVSSRGCPARCTFCSNVVTGRRFRGRSPNNVVEELVGRVRRFGIRHVQFVDDAFTAKRARVRDLCDAFRGHPDLRDLTWSCLTPATMLRVEDLPVMRRAGCVSVNVGIESGDPEILRQIRKGQDPEDVMAKVAAARAEGMSTVVNVMFGFPGEDVTALDRTLALMDRLAPHTHVFNHRGVLVPYPGTVIYEQWHETYGFTDWWLDPGRVVDEPYLADLPPDEVRAFLARDPALDRDFFRYDDRVRDKIAECVRYKARHNEQLMAANGAWDKGQAW